MKSLGNVLASKGLTLVLFLLVGMSNVIFATPRVATNPSGKSLDQVGDNAMAWFFDDVRPWIIVFLVVAAVLGGWLGGRFRFAIAGTCTGAIICLMALPSIISTIYGWM